MFTSDLSSSVQYVCIFLCCVLIQGQDMQCEYKSNLQCQSNGTFQALNETQTIHSRITTSYGLRMVTLICLSVSTACHACLLITYGLFRNLRTIPGLNLMNLSLAMCLSQNIWLIGVSHFEGTVICEIFAILQHYLMQASFLTMSVISHHTYLVFSQPFSFDQRIAAAKRHRTFIKYSTLVWLVPGIFIAICVALDKTKAFPVDYGMSNCWLGTRNAKLYLFLLPLAVLLLYNVCRYIQVARTLTRHDENRRSLQQREGKRNLIICTKLATMVGFPWLFSFLNVLFPQEAFEYLFVIAICLQGVCLAVIFIFKKNVLKLYKDRWNVVISAGDTEGQAHQA